MKNVILEHIPLRFTRFFIETSVLMAITIAIIRASFPTMRMWL